MRHALLIKEKRMESWGKLVQKKIYKGFVGNTFSSKAAAF